MNAYLLLAIVVVFGGLVPALWLGSRGRAVDRLLGLELTGATGTIVLILLSAGYSQSAYLIVPLILVPLSFAGTLVYTRLLAPTSKSDA